MVTLIFPYRNRSVQRVKRSLDSLMEQDNKDFEVQFIDYGTERTLAIEMEALVGSYGFCTYQYTYTMDQPWNKSRALNIIIKELQTPYCFVADIDMIFAPNFVSTLHQVKRPNTATYFQVGFLSEEESGKDKAFHEFIPKHLTTDEATGLTLFPVKALQALRGFDEFFHFWGAEDTDMHQRLKLHGLELQFYDKDVLLLHQWHLSFLLQDKSDIGKQLTLDRIEFLNQCHMDHNKELGIAEVNHGSWGNSIGKEQYEQLSNVPIGLKLDNQKETIDHLVYALLPTMANGSLAITIEKDDQNPVKRKLKKAIGKKTKVNYDMKTINDLILMNLIAHYRNNNYIYKVSPDGKKITLKIEL